MIEAAERRDPQLMRWLKTIFRILVLTGQTGVLGVRYLLYRRKGVSAFEKELSNLGINKLVVQELSQSYKSIGDVRDFLHYGRDREHDE